MALEYEFLQRVLLSLAVGALIGMEREYTKKQRTVGLRSFALVSFLGLMSVVLSQPVLFELPYELPFLPYIGLLVVIGYAFLVYYFLAKKEFFGITTTLSLPLTYLFGMLIGYGYFLAAIIGAIITTALLYSRRYSHIFVEHLTESELADALQFAIVIFIIYPLLPDQPLTLFGLQVLFKKFVEIIIILSTISFLGFIAIRFFGQRAIPLTGFFGGFVSALAVTVNYSRHSKEPGADEWTLLAGVSTASIASLIGDMVVLLYLNGALLALLYPVYVSMIAVLLLSSIPFFRHKPQAVGMQLRQPFSVMYGAKFALVYFAILLITEYLADFGAGALYTASFLAGIVSITSVTVSVALHTGLGMLQLIEGARAIFIAIFAGMLAKTGVLAFTASGGMRNKGGTVLLLAAAIGLVVLLLTT